MGKAARKLGSVQYALLEWILSSGGVTGITDRRIANALLTKGLVQYSTDDDLWTITPAGRLSLSQHGGGE